MTLAREPKQLSLKALYCEACSGILAVESWLSNPGCGILDVESWLSNPGCGILDVESWRRNQGEGIMEEVP